MHGPRYRGTVPCALLGTLLVAIPGVRGIAPAHGMLMLAPEALVQADGETIRVPGYSVPALADWDSDGRQDLLVGEGSGAFAPRLRLYLNTGTTAAPRFGTHAYVQADGTDLTVPGAGCLGLFPRVVHWDADERKDLLVGRADGRISLFLNTGTDASPLFAGATLLAVGQPGAKAAIDVGDRATPAIVDWNDDGRKDLVVGALDGRINVFLNEGTDAAPDFRDRAYAQANGVDLAVPGWRSSPVVLDVDADGIQDLVIGDTTGRLLFYANVGTAGAPRFASWSYLEVDGIPIQLPGPGRARPFAGDWRGDGLTDLLVGAGDGRVHLYASVPEPTHLIAIGVVVLLLRRRSTPA